MKVMLIYPLPRLRRKPGSHWIPLGLSYLGAKLLQAGHDVFIFDRYARAGRIGNDRDRLNKLMLEEFRDFKPDMVGFNTVTPLIWDTIECARLIRQEFTGIMAAGGHHATAVPGLTLEKIPELDYVIQGEGELVFPRLASGESPADLPGVWRRESGGVAGSAPVQIERLDLLPYPDYEMLDMNFYLQQGRSAIRGQHLRTATIITSRGCTQNCDFCTESITYGRGVRMHGPEYVLSWMLRLKKGYNPEAVYFLDNDFLIDRERAEAICRMIISSGLHRRLKFSIQTRVNRLDREILHLLKTAGCTLLEMGIETFTQAQLDAVHKGSTVEDNRKALDLCKEVGIPAHAYMMTGLPGENIDDLNQRMEWLKDAGRHFTISTASLQIYPGTKLYREKGDAFFENNEWTKENIEDYYSEDKLSSVTPEEKARWHRNSYAPEWVRRNRLALMKHNSPLKLFRLAVQKAGEVVTGIHVRDK